MKTTIHSNGGGLPQPIEALLDVLSAYVLDRRFGSFVEAPTRDGGPTRFFGNFLELSHVFRIDTNDPALVDKLTVAIEVNVRRPEFLAQPTPAQNERARRAREREQLKKLQERRA